MNWKEKLFQNFKLYGITDLRGYDESILKKIDQAYRGGTDIIQLRAKTFTDNEMLRLGNKIQKIAAKRRKLFIINDRPHIALLTEADGVHLGQEDLPLSLVRKVVGKSRKFFLLGKSTHKIEQALAAQREGADYIGAGPVFQTPTKPDYPAAGLQYIKEVHRKVRIPIVAIGGIDIENIHQVCEAGALRIAAVRAIFSSKEPYHAAQSLRKKIQACSK